MPTYFDPISQDELDIDESTTIYLVKVKVDASKPQENTYSIKGVSSGFQLLANDPHTHATTYWPVNIAFLLNQSDPIKRATLFPNDELTTKTLSVAQVIACLGFDPIKTQEKEFNLAITEELIPEWAYNISAGIDEEEDDESADESLSSDEDIGAEGLETADMIAPEVSSSSLAPFQWLQRGELGCPLKNGHYAIAGTHFGASIRIFDAVSNQLIREISQNGDGVSSMLQLADDNLAIAGAMEYAAIRIINPSSGQLVKKLSQYDEGVDCMIQLDDGNLVVAGSSAYANIRIIDPDSGDLVRQISQHGEGVNNMLLLLDGNVAIAGDGVNAPVRIINPDSGDLVDTIAESHGRITNVLALQSFMDTISPSPSPRI